MALLGSTVQQFFLQYPVSMRCGDGLDSPTTAAAVPESSECNESSFDFKCGMTMTPSPTVRSDAERATTAVGRKMEQCAGWVQEARDSLRGRRLFTLLAMVNLVNYLDRGVRGYSTCRVECGCCFLLGELPYPDLTSTLLLQSEQ